MSPTTRRRILLTMGVCIALFAVATQHGCATNDQGWETKPEVAPLPAIFVDVDAAALQRLCPPTAGKVTHGCAVRHFDTDRCFIYVEPDAPMWLATHELAHCAGFNHSR